MIELKPGDRFRDGTLVSETFKEINLNGKKETRSARLIRYDCGDTRVLRSDYIKKFFHTKSRMPRTGARASNRNQLIKGYKSGAKERGYSYSLSIDQFEELTTSNCFYCGMPPLQKYVHVKAKSHPYMYNGIDRVENNVGYQYDNCVPCCKLCNRAKGTMTQKDFLSMIESIYLFRIMPKE